MPRRWMSAKPVACDICKQPIGDEFYDFRTSHGPWATGCGVCFNIYGVGLGQGRGQHYVKDDGKDGFVKKAG